MRLKNTKTCNGCWSLGTGHGARQFRCDLRYKMKTVYDRQTSTPIEGVPQEPCPKPLTGKEWLDAHKAAEKAKGE